MQTQVNTKKTAGIVIDSWKLSIFRRHLLNAGYNYTTQGSPDSKILVLQVKYEQVDALEPVVRAANAECRMQKGKEA